MTATSSAPIALPATPGQSVTGGNSPPAAPSTPGGRTPGRAPDAAPAERTLLAAVGVTVAVVLWWLATDVVFANRPLVTQFSPVRTVRGLWELGARGVLLDAASASTFRLVAGLLVALALGTPIGLALGSSRRLEAAGRPVQLFLRMVSPLSWAPVAIIAFGIGDPPVVALVAATAVWPIAVATADGVRRVDARFRSVALSLGASRWEVLRSVTWPSIQPWVLSGLRQAIGIGWVVLVPAEMLGVTSGLGYQILNAKDQLAYHHITALIVVIGTLGYAIDTMAHWALRTRRQRRRRAA